MIKKLLLLILFFPISIFAYNADVIEHSYINKVNREKKYDVSYDNDILRIVVIEPKINAGEIYTYTPTERTIYYKQLNQTQTEKLDSSEVNIYNIFREINKKGDINKISKENYTIEVKYNNEKRPIFIRYYDKNGNMIQYDIKYK